MKLASKYLAGASLLCVSVVMAAYGETAEATDAKASHTDAAASTDASHADAAAVPVEALLYEGPVERIQVVGTHRNGEPVPGSATRLDEQDLEKFHYDDVMRVLRMVPGVNIQDEEGYGQRPNIGLRGTGVERSEKITLMEDGVLIAPAPYAAPAAYYFPTFARMEAVEVRKGSAAIKFGPRTVGGAVNLVSRSIPDEFGGFAEARLGEDGLRTLYGSVGGSGKNFGALVEVYDSNNDGFKRLPDGRNTGYDVEDYLIKLRVNTDEDAAVYQSLELKGSLTYGDFNETYIGLTEEDFGDDPYQRYAASQLDRLDARHEQWQLTHVLKTDAFEMVTVAYDNSTRRNWFKLQNARDLPVEVLRGDMDSAVGAVRIRNNARSYNARGIQSLVATDFEAFGAEHDLEFSVRYHEDYEDRLQNEENFQMLDGTLVSTSLGELGSKGNRISSANAWAFMVQDTITAGRLTLTPGLRFEAIDLTRTDWAADDSDRTGAPTKLKENSVNVLIPGMGISYRITDNTRLIGGIFKGFNPPAPGSTDAREETSLNTEFGFSGDYNGLTAEVIGFWSDYSNILGTCTNASGCVGGDVGAQFNGGKVRVLGLEAQVSYDMEISNDITVPLGLVYTYTDAEFGEDFTNGFWGTVERGDKMPYLPAHQFTLTTGLDAENWSLNLSGNYVSRTRTEAGQGAIVAGEDVDSRFVVDLGANYVVTDSINLFASVDNLFDEVYSVARRPYGLRPGKPRTITGGVRFNF